MNNHDTNNMNKKLINKDNGNHINHINENNNTYDHDHNHNINNNDIMNNNFHRTAIIIILIM